MGCRACSDGRTSCVDMALPYRGLRVWAWVAALFPFLAFIFFRILIRIYWSADDPNWRGHVNWAEWMVIASVVLSLASALASVFCFFALSGASRRGLRSAFVALWVSAAIQTPI